jgi:hypothetical protein
MPMVLTLPVRTWAALDAALSFFRFTPMEDPTAQRRARHCRRLHHLLQRSGVRALYVPVGIGRLGKQILRLHVRCIPSLREPLALELPLPVVRSLCRVCLYVLEVQADAGVEPLVDHEAEELRSIVAFLSAVRCAGPLGCRLAPRRLGQFPLAWDERREQYALVDPIAYRLHQHYLRVGAALN